MEWLPRMAVNILLKNTLLSLCFLSLLATKSLSAEATGLKGGAQLSVESITARFNRLVEAGQPERAKRLVQRFAGQPIRSNKEVAALWQLLTDLAFDSDDKTQYRQVINQAIQSNPMAGNYLHLAYYDFLDGEVSFADSLIWLANNQYPDIDRIDGQYIWLVFNGLEAYPEKQFELLMALYEAKYQQDRIPGYAGALYVDLAKRLLEKRLVPKAKEVIEWANLSLIDKLDIWHDKRFREVWQSLNQNLAFDPESIALAYIKKLEQTLEELPNLIWREWIRSKEMIVTEYRSIGNTVKAIDVGTKAIQDIPEEIQNDEFSLWLKQSLAWGYYEHGESEKALQLMRELTSINVEDSGLIVNFHINHSLLLRKLGKFELANEIADAVLIDFSEYTNGHGKNLAKGVKVCSLSQLKQSKAAEALFNEMYLSDKRNSITTLIAAICVEELVAAEKIIIHKLNNPEERASTLSSLSRFSLDGLSVEQRKMTQDLYRVLQKPKIQKLVKQYGRTGSWNLPAKFWGIL